MSTETHRVNEDKDCVTVKDSSVDYVRHYQQVWFNEGETPGLIFKEKWDGPAWELNSGEICFQRKDLLKFLLDIRKKINHAIQNVIFSSYNKPITDLFGPRRRKDK